MRAGQWLADVRLQSRLFKGSRSTPVIPKHVRNRSHSALCPPSGERQDGQAVVTRVDPQAVLAEIRGGVRLSPRVGAYLHRDWREAGGEAGGKGGCDEANTKRAVTGISSLRAAERSPREAEVTRRGHFGRARGIAYVTFYTGRQEVYFRREATRLYSGKKKGNRAGAPSAGRGRRLPGRRFRGGDWSHPPTAPRAGQDRRPQGARRPRHARSGRSRRRAGARPHRGRRLRSRRSTPTPGRR